MKGADNSMTQPDTRVFPSKLMGASLIGDEEMAELKDVIDSKSLFRHYGIGNPGKVKAVEDEMALYLGVKYALAVSSGSAALICAMAAINLQPGDEVVLPAFSWFSDYNSIINMGAVPVLADIDESMCLSADDFEKKITDRTKAVLIIHYQGSTGDLSRISDIARDKGILLIEDFAQSFGGEYQGKKLGSFGDISITSFQNNKLITCGEGGLVCTNHEEFYERAVRYHDIGYVRDVFANRMANKELAKNEERCFAGLQFRMSELQGAVLLAQLRKIPIILQQCRHIHEMIAKGLKLPDTVFLRPVHDGHCGIALFIRFSDPKEANTVAKILNDQSIPVGPASNCANLSHSIHVRAGTRINSEPIPVRFDNCPNTDLILSSYMAIGIGPLYSDEDAACIINNVNAAIRKCQG